ncbi:MAG: hypothetical protein Q8O30_08645 [Candidatus Omnitrophota bacterium]|nr:hypothetical protein [Candidatus Omnitrophota bacterium]
MTRQVKTVLLVFDDSLSLPKVFREAEKLEAAKFILCPLTTNDGTISVVREKLASISQAEIKLIDFPDIFNQVGYSLRSDFVNFISDFSEFKINNRTLKYYFKYPFKDFSIWWFSLIAEKNTLKTISFHNFAKFIAIMDIIDNERCKEVWMDIGNLALYESIRVNTRTYPLKIHNFNARARRQPFSISIAITTNLLFFLFSLLKRFVLARCNMKRQKDRIAKLKNSKYLAVTYFPLVDKKALDFNKFINRYYGPLQVALRKNEENSHSWLAMVVDEEGFDFSKSLNLANKINEWGDNLFVCEEWVGFSDLLRILVDHLYFSFRFLLIRPQIKKGFRYRDKLIIWPLFASDWLSSFCGKTLMEALYYSRVFTNVFLALGHNTKVLYLSEMHAWEKVLVCAGNKVKGLKIIALQHATVPLLLLHYFNSPSELDNKNIISCMPKPDFLGCSGRVTNRLFSECGWPRERLFFSGALRYQHLKNAVNNCDQKRKDKILVALSILPGESRELLYYLYQAFKGESGYKIVIKGHPDTPIETILKGLDVKFDEKLFDFVNTPLSELMKDSKVVITNVSSAAIEAIAYRLPVLSVLLSTYLNMNPLRGLCELVEFIKTPIKLREVATVHLKHFQLLDYDACYNFINDYFTFFNSDSEFLEKIEALN